MIQFSKTEIRPDQARGHAEELRNAIKSKRKSKIRIKRFSDLLAHEWRTIWPRLIYLLKNGTISQ